MEIEIKQILDDSYKRVKSILKKYAKGHKALAEALVERELLTAEDVKLILTAAERDQNDQNAEC